VQLGGMLVPQAQAGPLMEAELARADVLLRTGDPVHALALLSRLKVHSFCVCACVYVCMYVDVWVSVSAGMSAAGLFGPPSVVQHIHLTSASARACGAHPHIHTHTHTHIHTYIDLNSVHGVALVLRM